MIKLGHIIYSNCFPPHAGLVDGTVPFPFTLVNGIPSELNRMLLQGAIDLSPSSSIEYAMHPGRYHIMPGFSITSKNRAMSILLESRVPIEALDAKTVAMTTASATSVVLLRILLEVRYGLHPNYSTYEQGREDPSNRSDAMLTIGDLAMIKPVLADFPHRYDLGELWHAYTGLPFVFALWQVNYKKDIEQDLATLYTMLKTSKEYGLTHLHELARDHTSRFSVPADVLVKYWSSFTYHFTAEEQKGLLEYYRFAAEIGAVKPVKELRFWSGT